MTSDAALSGRAGQAATVGVRTAPPVRLRAVNSDKLTLAQLCDELQISRSTFYDWRAKGRAPKCIRLPNGDLRIRRADLDRWLDDHADADN